MEGIISMAKKVKSKITSIYENFDNEDNNKKIKIGGYLLLMLIIIIFIIMSYCNNDIDLSATSSGVFQRPNFRF